MPRVPRIVSGVAVVFILGMTTYTLAEHYPSLAYIIGFFYGMAGLFFLLVWCHEDIAKATIRAYERGRSGHE